MLIIYTNSCSSLPRKKKKKSNKTTGDCFKGSKTSLLIIDYIGSSLSRLARSSFSSCLGALLHRRVCFFFFFFFLKMAKRFAARHLLAWRVVAGVHMQRSAHVVILI
jgi:hypothetical protein